MENIRKLEAQRRKEYLRAETEIRNNNVFEKDILQKFLHIVGKKQRHYTISSKKKEVQDIFNKCSTNPGFTKDVIDLAEKILYAPPNLNQIDFAMTIVSLIEMQRHDDLIHKLNELLVRSGMKVISFEFKLCDHFPFTNSILTPDILFEDPYGSRYILEVKVRNKHTDLEHYYMRYKKVVGVHAKVGVFNLSQSGYMQHGDYKLSEKINLESDDFDDILLCVELAGKIREKYIQYPQYFLYTLQSEVTNPDSFIDGFKTRLSDLSMFEEIKSGFGDYWNDITYHMDNYSLIDNHDEVTEDLLNSTGDLTQYCNDLYDEFLDHSQSYSRQGKYGKTILRNSGLDNIIDKKNRSKYTITSKLKPSVYIPITKTIKLDTYGGSRLKFYKDAFINIKCTGDSYSRSAYNLVDNVFNTSSIDLLMTKDDKIDPSLYYEVLDPGFIAHLHDDQVKYKKIAKVTNITSDMTILANNSFSIHCHTDQRLKDNICGYDKKHYDSTQKAKECLDFSNSSLLLPSLGVHLSAIFKSEHHAGVYLNDLVTLGTDNLNHMTSDIPEEAQTKFLEHLYNSHIIFKAIISLNTINSHKFRLLQSPDPGTIIILLPNSDGLKGAPLRYFVVSILQKQDNDSIEANKLLGIYHSHTESKKYKIMLSKVISLDITRLKLLSNSFVKYSLLISYYSQFKKSLKFDTHMLSWMLSQFTTIASLSITDVYKNFIMAIYSDYSNIDDLINDKLECRPRTLGHVFVMKHLFQGITSAVEQLGKINKNKLIADVNDEGELISTGFDPNLRLKLPISQLSTNNPKEIIHESFILFYLGNKGLHGSPQELLNLYYTPMQFESEYTKMMTDCGLYCQELGNNGNLSFSFQAMLLTSKVAYAKLLNNTDEIRRSLVKEMKMDEPIMSIKQFSSTKSMVSNSVPDMSIKDCNLNKNIDVIQLERYIDTSLISDPMKYITLMNNSIESINQERLLIYKDKLNKGIVLLPKLILTTFKGKSFIGLENHYYTKLVSGDYIKQTNTKVFDEFYRLTDEIQEEKLRGFYKGYITEGDLLVRIFNKDQRTTDDREIYTGNAQVRLCLYPLEMTFKSICKKIPEEAITISGDQKQRKLLEQRLALIKTKRQFNKSGYKTEIYSVSSDASKWSARDLLPKFIISIATNPYLTSDEKYFLVYLLVRYYDKKIVLTDSAFSNALRFSREDINGKYEEMTNNFTQNWFNVRSNWLQGNLNMTSSFVHHCSTIMTDTLLSISAKHNGFEAVMTSMVHSDDSTYDFLIAKNSKTSSYINNEANMGRFIISLITYSNKKHCITLNEKKTYISTFYKEFLSTTIVSNELFFFYMADLMPISSDTSYKSPLEDLASYTGYINNSFSHACPIQILKCAITLLNHLTLSTYNMQYTSEKNPRCNIPNSTDLPIQIYPRYKLPLSLAGCIPYYSSDAYNILDDIIKTLEKNKVIKNSLLEDVIDDETLDEYITLVNKQKPEYAKYIQACLLTMDYTQYERDDEDPYNIVDYDLSQKSIINVASINKGSRIKKTYTYKKYLENETDIRLTSCVNPMWCIAKPKDEVLIKKSILANYMNPNFKDSLIFSKSALDYGRRIIGSNKSMYTLSSHAFEKEKKQGIKTIYKKLDDKISTVEISKQSLQRFLSVYLFSDKKISVALQVYYSKVQVLVKTRPEFTKVIMPRSVYAEEYGKNSNTSMVENLLVEQYCEIEQVDSKVEKFISFCKHVLQRCGDIKIYRDPEDIDDDFRKYIEFKYTLKDATMGLIQPHQHLAEYAFDVYNNKLIFQGLMVRYYIDICETISNPSYNIPSYTSPNSIIMTLDSLMKRDEISSKIYISHIRTNRFDEYWLSRFGMYVYENYFVKYKLGYRIKIAANEKLMPTMKKVRNLREPFKFICSLVANDPSLFIQMTESPDFQISSWKYSDIIAEMKSTTDFSYNLFLYMMNEINFQTLMRVMNLNRRVWNHWLIKTDSEPSDPNASIALYMYQSTVVKVQTKTIGGGVTFSMLLLRHGMQHRQAFDEISKKIASDYAPQLRIANIIPQTSFGRLQLCVNEYGRTVKPGSYRSSCICNVNIAALTDLKPDIAYKENTINQIVTIISPTFEGEFVFKLNTYCDSEYYTCVMLENLDLNRVMILDHLCRGRYLIENPEYFTEISDQITPGACLALFSNNVNNKLWSNTIDTSKFAKLVHIGNYLKIEHEASIVTKLCDSLVAICALNGIDHTLSLKPDNFIKSLRQYKLSYGFHEEFYNNYKKNEREPYTELIMAIASTAGDPFQKVILAIITIFKAYTDLFISYKTDEVEF
uniref:RNA-directed RNA polymerase L n=8 Tax=European mountain ash ringspot-associated virus (isolate Sorbus aucuparia) TaxID=1980426 RepID=A0A4U8YUI0_EMARV|nr:RNA-dependent RNA polymerase [European mountain ash ringspot-associated virus]